MHSRTRSLVLTGLSIALIAVGACITVPFGPVPFTLQTMMIGIVVCLLPPLYSVAAVGGYLLLGLFGLPVFSGFRGGIAVLLGPTGGFLLGFLVAALFISFMRSRIIFSRPSSKDQPRPAWLLPVTDVLSLIIFALLYYTFGSLWFMVSTNATFEASLAVCVLPFIVADILKAAAAFVCIQAVRKAIDVSLPAT